MAESRHNETNGSPVMACLCVPTVIAWLGLRARPPGSRLRRELPGMPVDYSKFEKAPGHGTEAPPFVCVWVWVGGFPQPLELSGVYVDDPKTAQTHSSAG